MQQLERNKDVLLFYVKHKWDFVETYSTRTISGFYSWYTLLVRSLKEKGYRVYENNYALARANPEYPIGVVGTPLCIKNWSLPNPAVLGPCMYDHPSLNPSLMQDKRFKYYLITCEWLKDVFAEVYGESCVIWNAGIPLDEWSDTSKNEKFIDVLIYDKIRWERNKIIPFVLEPIITYLKLKNMSYTVLQYGDISHERYKEHLSCSKSMIFLCEHETQGMAYQEALASNVPILAWDYGWWTDPVWTVFAKKPIQATSIPYFSDECGEKFKMTSEFSRTFEKFWSNIEKYQPRNYIKKHLSLSKSAEQYAAYYFSI